MKKYQSVILWVAIWVLGVFSIITYRQLGASKGQIERATSALLNYHATTQIEHLFHQARTAPTQENLGALTETLLERKKKYEAIIHLYRPQVNPDTWALFEQRPNEQSTVFFLNLSSKSSISNEDWETFDRIAQVWKQNEDHLQIDIGGLVVTNPTSFTFQYQKMIKELDAVTAPK